MHVDTTNTSIVLPLDCNPGVIYRSTRTVLVVNVSLVMATMIPMAYCAITFLVGEHQEVRKNAPTYT